MSLYQYIKNFGDKNRSFLFNLLNLLFYVYMRTRWAFDVSRFRRSYSDIKIYKPVFLLGVHFGGLTIISRMIRRHKDFVSVSGNYKYWSGADEMAVVLGSLLPAEFTGILHNVPKESGLPADSGWPYAADQYISYYRKTRNDVSPGLRERFVKIIKWTIFRNAINKSTARFIDKSQVFSVRLSFLNEILKDTNPKFILVTRDPYAVSYSAAKGDHPTYKKIKADCFDDRLKLVAQHWSNSIKYALKDSEETKDFLVVRLEDFMKNPRDRFKKICDFIEIEFDEDLLPQPGHKVPFGTRSYYKWYPLESGVNEKYLKKLLKRHIDIIESVVEPISSELGYKRPDR